MINLVFTCKLLRIMVSTWLNCQLLSQFLHIYYLPKHCLKSFIKVHIFVLAYINMHRYYFLITCNVPCTVLRMWQTILFTMHSFIIKWTILGIGMTTSKITRQCFWMLTMYTPTMLSTLFYVKYLINLHNHTLCYVLLLYPLAAWEKWSRQF